MNLYNNFGLFRSVTNEHNSLYVDKIPLLIKLNRITNINCNNKEYLIIKLTYPELSLPLFPIAIYSDNCFISNFKICSLRLSLSYSYTCIKALDARSRM